MSKGGDRGAVCNVEAEAAILGAILQFNDLIDVVADIVEGEDFYIPLHKRIYDATVYEFSQGRKITPVGLKPYFVGDAEIDMLGGVGYIARLTGNDVGMLAPRELAQQIADLAHRRRMQAGLQAALDACSDLDSDIGTIIGHADAALSGGKTEEFTQLTAAECVDEVIAGLDEPQNGVLCGCISALDDVLGPIRPKQLIIGAGRPGMGKTAMAISYAVGAARQDHGVLFVSLEMSSRELGERMIADLCFDRDNERIPYAAIQNGRVTDQQRQTMREAREFIAKLPLAIVDAGHMTIGRLNMLVRRHARRMEAKGQKLELVIVDYLQLLRPDQRARDLYQATAEISRGLKLIAKDNGVGMLALAQLSREVEKREDKRPMLSDLRDSGTIEQDADGVLFLLRQEYYLKKNEPDASSEKHEIWQAAMRRHQGTIDFIVPKRRGGVEGQTTGRFYGPYQAVR